MNEPSIYPYSLIANFDLLLSALQKHFDVFTVTSVAELRDLLKKHAFFCNLIAGNVHEASDLREIQKICSAFPKLPCLFYGKVSDPELVFQLADTGIKDFVQNANTQLLLEKLQELKAQATFRIDLRDFGVDLDQCSLWTRKFIMFIIKDYKFLKYRRVDKIANQLKISPTTLYHNLNGDCWISPKQLLLCLQNYYAAHLLSFSHSQINSIAQKCGFADEQIFSKSFKKATGVTPEYFSREHDWKDYPSLYVAKYKRKITKSQ